MDERFASRGAVYVPYDAIDPRPGNHGMSEKWYAEIRKDGSWWLNLPKRGPTNVERLLDEIDEVRSIGPRWLIVLCCALGAGAFVGFVMLVVSTQIP